jgi:hypothetical protein
MAPNDENATFLQRIEDSRLRPRWRLTNVLIKVRNGALTPRDVKNEGTSGDVYENKGAYDTMPDNTSGLLSDKYKSCAIIGAKSDCF